MKIIKFVHSCLLVETPERTGLIDPGIFSWQSGTFNITKLNKLDELIITHEHSDHFHMPFVEALLEKFPKTQIVTTSSVKKQLKEAGYKDVVDKSTESVKLFQAEHEVIEPYGATPENTGIHYLERLTHPGDCHHFNETKEILALPVTAPWGTVIDALNLALKLKPKFVLPIHDWHFSDQARDSLYCRFEDILSENDITMLMPTTAQTMYFDD